MKVLLAEDDRMTRQGLTEILQDEGYQVFAAEDGSHALALFQREKPDFICLDIMMPKKDGFQVIRAIRQANSMVPIIFISAKSEEIDKVVGLELGADDFIVKPFGVREVIARIRAVTRRCLAVKQKNEAAYDALKEPFRLGDLEIFPAELRARRGSTVIDLSLRETRMLSLFSANPGKVLSRQDISFACWDEDHLPTSRTLDQHVSLLRKRIETDHHAPRLIQTVHGVGYRYDPF
ncbi:response regulator transcription factor [bacterium]|nr:response regulator transcription factor [bacterium]